MKDLGNAACVPGIQVFRGRKNKVLAQGTYIDKVLACFSMQNSHGAYLPMRSGIFLSKEHFLRHHMP